jgi:hypothetical protein
MGVGSAAAAWPPNRTAESIAPAASRHADRKPVHVVISTSQ